ncbi:hypothetical protein N7492_005040 [Penicillium capsulatum]|uniref:Uncharacterized protein n=1 Tax=Penicillium capsulatum TaxID=69766 RepID=A0A9W9ICP4_9EURO|nr:hypothetical protein N7492_005040 [Penicillium capsulatum]KAJ6135852.1 hypothetical protein N7512_001012 [Penicillium capsulatum]
MKKIQSWPHSTPYNALHALQPGQHDQSVQYQKFKDLKNCIVKIGAALPGGRGILFDVVKSNGLALSPVSVAFGG